jgi:hypothetical protein
MPCTLMMLTRLAVGLEPLNALDAAHRAPRSVPLSRPEFGSPVGSATRRSIKRNKELMKYLIESIYRQAGALAEQKESLNCQLHCGMNFPNGVIGQSLSPIRSIFGSMADVPKRFSNHGHNGSFTEVQCSSRADVQGKSSVSPAENGLAYVTPLRFRWYFDDDSAGFIAARIL